MPAFKYMFANLQQPPAHWEYYIGYDLIELDPLCNDIVLPVRHNYSLHAVISTVTGEGSWIVQCTTTKPWFDITLVKQIDQHYLSPAWYPQYAEQPKAPGMLPGYVLTGLLVRCSSADAALILKLSI